MQGIYEALSAHLAVHGGTTPEQMVSQGAFVVARDRIALAPGWPLTWQTFTALLLLQRAFHNQRSLSREAVAGRRRQGRYLRLPSRRQRNLHFSNSPFSRYPSTNSPILYSSILQSPPFTFSLTPALRPPTPAIRSSTLTQKQQECGPVLESFHGSPVLECSNSPPPPARIIMK
jgi:hypothetical protein